MRAAVLQNYGVLDLLDLQIDKPLAHEVLVRTVGSGLCASDMHHMDGDLPTAGFTPHSHPMVLGHEGAGVVEAVGSDVTYVRPGDHVVTFTRAFCGVCEFCLSGRPYVCVQSIAPRAATLGSRLSHDGKPVGQFCNLGGFAEQMLVHEHSIVKIDPDYPLERACILGCGVCTGAGAVLNTAQVRPGASVAITGVGGVGLSAVQAARLAGAGRIIAIDINRDKLALASKAGATDFVDAGAGDVAEQVMELTSGGVDYAFDCVGTKATAEHSVRMLRRSGAAVVIGAAPKFEVDGYWLLTGDRRILGSVMGSTRFRTDLPRYIELDMQGRFDVGLMIESNIALEDINASYNELRDGKVNGRRVIKFS
jgi:S-(hydroxymethyl)glutathione dehydrogenase/alcohol dehydrogenase